MSAADDRERARGWLAEQLDQLDGLCNANPRDPSFKLWRQNTLTVLQRIWPHEPYRSERFRRITFSPATAKPAGALVREFFTRGCDEAKEYLASLAEEIEIVGAPKPTEPRRRPAGDEAQREDDVPLVDLDAPSSGSSTSPSPAYAMEDNVLDLGAPSSASLAGADSPGGPPRLKVELRPFGQRPDVDTHAPAPHVPAPKLVPPTARDANTASDPGASPNDPGGEAPLVLPPIGHEPVPAPEGIERTPVRPAAAQSPKRVPKPARAKKSGPKPKLKNLLGFDHLVSQVSSHATDEPSPPPTTSAAPPAALPPPPKPVAAPPAAIAPPTPAPAPEPPTPAPAPASEPPADEGPEIDAEAFTRATEDFMRNSPVLGLQGKPVQRATDVTQFLDPDAVAVATFAADLARFGVDEAARGTLRATLLELASALDHGSPEWPALRRAVSDAMAYPDLARRLVPVLLPWFERAA